MLLQGDCFVSFGKHLSTGAEPRRNTGGGCSGQMASGGGQASDSSSVWQRVVVDPSGLAQRRRVPTHTHTGVGDSLST